MFDRSSDASRVSKRPLKRCRGVPSPRWLAAFPNGTTIIRWAAVAALVLMLAGCGGETHLSFLDPQGPVAQIQSRHFYWVLGILVVLVAGPIFLLVPLIVWRYRYGKKSSRYTPKWKFSRFLEIAAWGGPIFIVIVLGFFVWRDTHALDPYKPLVSKKPPLHVQVIGYDWKWLFIYPDQGIASIGTLVVPAGRPISMQITSATVMQSLFIPALGSQIYAMGGMVSQLNLEARGRGRFMGENTMYNGNGFHKEQFTAVALSDAHFKAWVKMVHGSGIALDAHTLQIISRRADRGDLIAALPRVKVRSMHGNVYFTDVKKSLFPAVVKAIKDGRRALPGNAFAPASPPSPRGGNGAHAPTEHTR